MFSLADYRQDMQQNHTKFFESVQNFQARPPSASFSGSNFASHGHIFSNGADLFGDDSATLRPRSGSGDAFCMKEDYLESITANPDDFPPISTFYVASSPSPRKNHGQQPPRSNRFRRGQNFRMRNGNENYHQQHHARGAKVRHDSYSSNEGNFGSMSIQQQQAANEAASNSQNNADFIGRYKTELCRPFMENGECKYGDKCQFAHGRHELKQMSRHPKYKTEYCRTFHTVGFCPYGPRCHFLHLLDLDNPSSHDDNNSTGLHTSSSASTSSSSDEQNKIEQSTQLALTLENRGESESPATLDEPCSAAESVFASPSTAAISPISSSALSTCSEAAQSSGIGLSSPNVSESSNVDIVVNDTEFPPLQTTLSNDCSASSQQLSVDRLHLLTISTGATPEDLSGLFSPNFARLQQQKRLQAEHLTQYCRQIAAARPRRLPIFSSLAN